MEEKRKNGKKLPLMDEKYWNGYLTKLTSPVFVPVMRNNTKSLSPPFIEPGVGAAKCREHITL